MLVTLPPPANGEVDWMYSWAVTVRDCAAAFGAVSDSPTTAIKPADINEKLRRMVSSPICLNNSRALAGSHQSGQEQYALQPNEFLFFKISCVSVAESTVPNKMEPNG
jgi:hypothetical protein